GARQPAPGEDQGRPGLPGADLFHRVQPGGRRVGVQPPGDEPGGGVRHHHRKESLLAHEGGFRCMSVSHRIHAIRVATKREIRSTLHGIGLYVVLSLVFLVASYVFANTVLRNVGDAGILALPNPVTLPLIVSTGLAAAYLGLCSSLSISRDRDLGTMEVLFYGPVDAVAYVLGKYFHQLAAYGVVLAFTLVNFYGLSVVTNVGFSLEIAGIMLLSVFLTSCMVSFGIVLSAGSRRMMVSVTLFLGFVLFFLIFSLVHAWVIGAAGRDAASTMVYVR